MPMPMQGLIDCQMFREVRMMKCLEHPNIGMSHRITCRYFNTHTNRSELCRACWKTCWKCL